MSLLGGKLCEVAYTNPLLPPFKLFTPIMGAWPLVPLSYASDSGAARICQRGGGGVKAREGGGGYREIFFENLCMKMAFSCTLNAIIRG